MRSGTKVWDDESFMFLFLGKIDKTVVWGEVTSQDRWEAKYPIRKLQYSFVMSRGFPQNDDGSHNRFYEGMS